MFGDHMDLIHKQHAKIFKAFCDENRLMILSMLRQGERCACELQAVLPIGQSTLSHHMKILCDSGIVIGRKEGKWIHYSIDKEGGKYALDLMAQLIQRNENYANSYCSIDECCAN